MNFFKRTYLVRRYSKPVYVRGYASIGYEDTYMQMDIQTTEDTMTTDEDGTKSKQRLKVFCDSELLIEIPEKEQKADRIYFQDKWFDCTSCRLSDNTPLRHWTATFVECAKPGDEEEE